MAANFLLRANRGELLVRVADMRADLFGAIPDAVQIGPPRGLLVQATPDFRVQLWSPCRRCSTLSTNWTFSLDRASVASSSVMVSLVRSAI